MPWAADVAAINDGAEWIQGFVDLHCPQAGRMLDFAHAASYLATAATAAFGEGTAAVTAWFGTQPPLPEPERLPDGVREGIELFNERHFFEAHEVIEHEWHAERGSIRRLYQGILQIGVGFYHALNGNHRGAVLLLTDGIEKTNGFLPAALSIDTARLVEDAGACLREIEALGPDRLREFNTGTIPLIHLAVSQGNTGGG